MNKLPEFSDEIRSRAREAVTLAAKWHAANQVRHKWPHWTADAGRFCSTRNLADAGEKPMLSICWNTSRGAQALMSAYLLTKDESILETAKLAMEYVKICQIFLPEFPHHAGACCEETPQTDHIASRDTVEAVQGFINLYAVTKDPVLLLRAQAGADWHTGWFLKSGYPNGYIWHKYQGDKGTVCNDFSRLMLSSMALSLAQIDALTGKKKYAAFIPKYLDWVIDSALEKDGALKMHDGTNVGHHAVRTGPLAGCFTNDDGVGVALIAAFRATGEEKYREAALRNGEWWLNLPGLPETYASIPAGLNFLLDLHRFTGDKRYLDKSAPYLERTLQLQVRETDTPLAQGGFRGHDLEGKRETEAFSAGPENYISHRTTMYSMMALAKAAARSEGEWNLAYSGFGW